MYSLKAGAFVLILELAPVYYEGEMKVYNKNERQIFINPQLKEAYEDLREVRMKLVEIEWTIHLEYNPIERGVLSREQVRLYNQMREISERIYGIEKEMGMIVELGEYEVE